jgi:hypothetical protein
LQVCRYVLVSPFSPLHRTTYSRKVPTCVHTYHIQRSSYPHPVLPVRQQPSRPYPPTTRTQVQPVHLAVLSNGRMRYEHTYTHPPTSSQHIPIPRGCNFPILRLHAACGTYLRLALPAMLFRRYFLMTTYHRLPFTS